MPFQCLNTMPVCGSREALFVALPTLSDEGSDVPCDCEEDEEEEDAQGNGGVAVDWGIALMVGDSDVDCAFGHGDGGAMVFGDEEGVCGGYCGWGGRIEGDRNVGVGGACSGCDGLGGLVWYCDIILLLCWVRQMVERLVAKEV
jgi:hypothetical protein